MTRHPQFLLALPVAALASIAVVAQTTPDASRLTVEGCITKDDRTDRSTAATQFVLTDRNAATPPVANAGSSTGAMAAGQNPAKKAYTLRSDVDTVKLDAHVGKMVRVTGTSTAPSTTSPLAGRSPEATPHPGTAGTPGAAGTSGSTGTAFDTANLPTLVVTSIATIAGTCR